VSYTVFLDTTREKPLQTETQAEKKTEKQAQFLLVLTLYVVLLEKA